MRQIQVGQRFRKVDSVRTVWQVVAVAPERGTPRHYRIVAMNDPSTVRLISEKALANPKLYQPLEEEGDRPKP